MPSTQNQTPLVEMRDVRKLFAIKGGKHAAVHAVDGVSLDIHRGETLGCCRQLREPSPSTALR